MIDTIKALSLKQPWANWIAWGLKTLETRTFQVRHRGPLLICASKTVDKAALELHPGHGIIEPRGVAVAICELTHVRLMRPEDEHAAMCPCTVGRYVWILQNVRPIRCFPVKGQLGIFNVTPPGPIVYADPAQNVGQPRAI